MASGKRWLDMDKKEANKIELQRKRQEELLHGPLPEEKPKEKLMTGDTKRAIIDDLIKLEKEHYENMSKGIFDRVRPYAILAERYNVKENKIATIKHFYKEKGEASFIDDKVRGGFRPGAGKPSNSKRKWREQRGFTKENDWGKNK